MRKTFTVPKPVKNTIFILIITILPIIFINWFNESISNSSDNLIESTSELPDETTKYGIKIDSFIVETEKIKYNQYLASIISAYNTNPFNTDEIIKKVQQVFDIRKIKAGNYYSSYFPDSTKNLRYFIYEHSITECLKISLTDSIRAEIIYAKIDTVQKSASGIIKTSLWETMLENNINPMLALELSEIYAWTIDFFGLQENDYFKVIYDELLVDSVSIGIGKIYAATFNHMQTDYSAFYFAQDKQEGYFDENGNSLKKAFLKAPLRYNRISSRYSYARFHPILKIRRPHKGVDYAAPKGTPIVSIGDGVVVEKGYTQSAGYYIKVKHNGVYISGYNHLSKYGKGMQVGKKVKQGQVIGYVGSTGYATGPHLDFRIWKNGHLIDPLKIKAPPVEPVREENHHRFAKIKNLMNKFLKSV